MAARGSSGTESNRFHMGATGKFLDARDNFLAMMEKLISHDGMRCQHDELVALNHGRMRI